MNPYLAGLPLILLVVLIVGHQYYLKYKNKKELQRVRQETVDGVRRSVVKYLNKELTQFRKIDPMKLHTKCKDIQEMYPGMRIWNDIIHGFVMIDIRYEGIEDSIECYQEPPSWYDGIERKYQVD